MYTKGEWEIAFATDNARGVRTSNGFICFLPKPFHYTGQDVRYQEELDEAEANARLIATAPKLLAACKIHKDCLELNEVLPAEKAEEIFDKYGVTSTTALKKLRDERIKAAISEAEKDAQ